MIAAKKYPKPNGDKLPDGDKSADNGIKTAPLHGFVGEFLATIIRKILYLWAKMGYNIVKEAVLRLQKREIKHIWDKIGGKLPPNHLHDCYQLRCRSKMRQENT